MDLAKIGSELGTQWGEILDPRKIEFDEGYIRDPIHGHVKLTPKDFFVIDIPPFQRLRGVSQLSFVDRIYPGAHHNRFEHCLGAARIAHRIMDRLQQDQAVQEIRRITENDIWTVKIAAYLHDIGHLPFSHAVEPLFESIPPFSTDQRAPHEQIGFAMLKTTYFSDLFEHMNRKFPQLNLDPAQISVLAAGDKKQVRSNADLFMYEIIHGKPVDCDRLDYLLRDAYYCGVPHGEVDVERLIETFTLVKRDNGVHLAIDESGLLALEAMAVSRSTMYGAVYNHRTSRIAEGMMLRALHYQQQEHQQTLQSIIGKTDDFVFNLLSTGCKIAKGMVERLLFRRFFKKIFDIKLHRICGLQPNMDYRIPMNQFGKALRGVNRHFASWSQHLVFEESCLISPNHKGEVVVDCPKLNLPKPPLPDEYTPISYHDNTQPPPSIVEVSPIVHAVEMERDAFATSILCASSRNINRELFGDKVKQLFNEKFGIVLS